jgi:hypothetical protein
MIQANARAAYMSSAPMVLRPVMETGYFFMDLIKGLPGMVVVVAMFIPLGMYHYKPLDQIVEQGAVFTDAGTHRVPAGTMELLDKRQASYKRATRSGEDAQQVHQSTKDILADNFKCETDQGLFVLEKFGLKDSADGLGGMIGQKKISAEDVVGSSKEIDAEGNEVGVDVTKERVKMFHQRIQQAKGIGGGPQGHNSPGVKPVNSWVCRATGHVFINGTDGNRLDLLPKGENGEPMYMEPDGETPLRYFKVYKNTVMAKKNLHSFLMDYQGRVIELGESDREHYMIFWDKLRRKNESTGFQSFGVI